MFESPSWGERIMSEPGKPRRHVPLRYRRLQPGRAHIFRMTASQWVVAYWVAGQIHYMTWETWNDAWIYAGRVLGAAAHFERLRAANIHTAQRLAEQAIP